MPSATIACEPSVLNQKVQRRRRDLGAFEGGRFLFGLFDSSLIGFLDFTFET